MLTKLVANKPLYTYNALYVSVSGGFSIPCMVVNSMSQTTIAICFYTKYFGHVTNCTCMPCDYPCGFVLSCNQLSICDDQWSISPHGFVYISSQHPGISLSTNQMPWSKYSAHGYHEGLPFFKQKVHQSIRKLQTSSINQW